MRVGVGMIGLGMAAEKHALALADLAGRAGLRACWSPSAARRAGFASRHGVPVADTLEAVLDDPAIGLVLVLSPPWSHLDLVRACAERGKHVLLEKPVEATVARAEALVAACADARVRLGVVFQNRFRAPYRRLAPLLRAGALGQPVSVATTVRWWRPDSYYREPGRGRMEHDGGGVLLTQAIHTLDLLLALVGEPETVVGLHATSPGRAIDTEDVAVGLLRWAGGALGVVDATTAAFPTTPERIDIAATEGSARLERNTLVVTFRDGRRIEVAPDEPPEPEHAPHRRLLEDMLDAIAEGREPECGAAAGLAAQRLVARLLAASGGTP